MQIKKQITVLNDEIRVRAPNDSVTVPTFQLPVGWAGTVVAEGSLDDGTTWGAVTITANDAVETKTVSVAAAGLYTCRAGSYTQFRIRVSVAGAGGIAALSLGMQGGMM